jgi:hypothetical protein
VAISGAAEGIDVGGGNHGKIQFPGIHLLTLQDFMNFRWAPSRFFASTQGGTFAAAESEVSDDVHHSTSA